MAQFFTNFAEYTLGQAPGDWDALTTSGENWTVETFEAEATLQGGPDGGGTDDYGLFWVDAGTAIDDVEILALGETSLNNSSSLEVVARSDVSAVGFLANAYRADFNPNTDVIRLRKVVAGSLTTLGTAPLAHSPGDRVWVRFRCEGTAIKVRVWLDGNSEPGTWGIEVTDSALSSGRAGVNQFEERPQANWYQFGVGTDGDLAPVAPSLIVSRPVLPGLIGR